MLVSQSNVYHITKYCIKAPFGTASSSTSGAVWSYFVSNRVKQNGFTQNAHEIMLLRRLETQATSGETSR